MPQILIPTHLRDQLLANGARSAASEDIDPVPVVKLFTPDANATWPDPSIAAILAKSGNI
jgi:hypothetical protein